MSCLSFTGRLSAHSQLLFSFDSFFFFFFISLDLACSSPSIGFLNSHSFYSDIRLNLRAVWKGDEGEGDFFFFCSEITVLASPTDSHVEERRATRRAFSDSAVTVASVLTQPRRALFSYYYYQCSVV